MHLWDFKNTANNRIVTSNLISNDADILEIDWLVYGGKSRTLLRQLIQVGNPLKPIIN